MVSMAAAGAETMASCEHGGSWRGDHGIVRAWWQLASQSVAPGAMVASDGSKNFGKVDTVANPTCPSTFR